VLPFKWAKVPKGFVLTQKSNFPKRKAFSLNNWWNRTREWGTPIETLASDLRQRPTTETACRQKMSHCICLG